MKFQWPELLALLLVLPLLAGLYLWLLRRRKRGAVRFASLAVVKEAMGRGQALRRHVPPALLMLALAALLVGVARPSAMVNLPGGNKMVVLAIDVSGSMRAGDVKPSRIAAAQAAARAFVAEQPAGTRVGLVSFAATASPVQVPTHDREAIVAAIERLQLQRGTALGSAILVSLKQIHPEVEYDLRSDNPRPDPTRRGFLDPPFDPNKPKAEPVAPGSDAASAIILLSDGQRTAGPDPIEAAKMAAERGVRVFTVGVGTTMGEVVGSEGMSMRVKLDEAALEKIAEITQGEYFRAETSAQLERIYSALNAQIAFEKREIEVTALFAAAGAALALAAAALSLVWFGRFTVA